MNALSIAVADERAPALLGRARTLVGALTTDAPAQFVLDAPTVELAVAEGLAAWLGARVAEGRVVVPSGRAEQLVWEHQMCVAASLVRGRAVRWFEELCGEAALPFAWLKGMALVQGGVIEPGARSMLDADVLVPASRWDEACRIAAALPGAAALHPEGRRFTATHDYVRAFVLPGATLEVHRFVCEASLFAIEHVGPEGLFARATPAPSGGWRLDEGDLFLTLAAHAAKHTFDLPLRSFLDGVVLARRGRLGWGPLAARARRWRMDTSYHLWLRCLEALAPSLLPATEARRWRDPPLAELVWSHTRDASAWQRFLRLAWIVDGSMDWARHVATRVGFRIADVVQARRGDIDPGDQAL